MNKNEMIKERERERLKTPQVNKRLTHIKRIKLIGQTLTLRDAHLIASRPLWLHNRSDWLIERGRARLRTALPTPALALPALAGTLASYTCFLLLFSLTVGAL